MSDCNCGTVAEVLRIAFSGRCVRFEGDMPYECIVNISNVLMDRNAAYSTKFEKIKSMYFCTRLFEAFYKRIIRISLSRKKEKI